MYREVYSSSSSSRAEDEDELGDSSSLSGGSDDDESGSSQNKSSSISSQASLHQLSSLVSQLPIKKGLSKFYQGKSQSFSSFSDVTTAGDLAKKEASKMTMKPSRSYGGGLDDGEAHQQKPNNSSCSGPRFNSRGGPKKGGPARASCASSIARTTSGSSYFASGKPPAIPMNKKM